MRLKPAALTLLLASASAIPSPFLNRSDTSGLTNKQRKLCGLKNENPEEREKTWDMTGKPFLENFFKNHKVKGWSCAFFTAQTNHGIEGSCKHDCMHLTSETCGAGDATCQSYTTPEANFVHLSMYNLHSAFNSLHEHIQDKLLDGLYNAIDDVNKVYGPPDPRTSGLNSYLIGGLILGAAMAGPVWVVAAPLVAVAGIINIINGVQQDSHPLTPDELGDDMKHAVGKFFDNFKATLVATCDSVFGGDSNALEGQVDDPAKWIQDIFAHGRMLDGEATTDAMNIMWGSVQNRINQAMVVIALKKTGWFLMRSASINEDECKKKNQKAWLWLDGRCTAIVKDTTDKQVNICSDKYCAGTDYTVKTLDDEQLEKFTGKYRFDREEAFRNAIDCAAPTSDGKLEVPNGLPPFGEKVGMPKCFFNLDVKNLNSDGDNSTKPDPGWHNNDGYTPGQCGVHIKEKTPNSDYFGYEIEAILKDGQGGILTTATYQKTMPTAVVKGKESDKDAKLPYDFFMAVDEKAVALAGEKDDTPLQFWYSDQYFRSDDGGYPGCKFQDVDDGRVGDCGFDCKSPSDNPPASATKRHPLPTSVPYAKGWCTLHLKETLTHGEMYGIEMTLYDSKKIKIGTKDGTVLDFGQSTGVSGVLPYDLVIVASEDRMGPVTFKYGDKSWTADDAHGSRNDGGHECSYGKDNSGTWDKDVKGFNIEMDCGFWC